MKNACLNILKSTYGSLAIMINESSLLLKGFCISYYIMQTWEMIFLGPGEISTYNLLNIAR